MSAPVSKLRVLSLLAVLLLQASRVASNSTSTSTSTSAAAAACSDSTYYTFNNNRFQTCEWVDEKPNDRCNLIDEYNSVQVKNECPRTCGTCSSSRAAEAKAKQKQSVGQFCAKDGDCESWTCRQNTCYASPECKALKHFPDTTFDENMVILVFVGSGFTDLETWRMHVAKTFYAFNEFEFFDYSNPRYNAFYVDELEPDGFCNFNCQGVPTLLCCNESIARTFTSKCFPPGAHVNTIVIENSDTYGGGGYRSGNLATTSIHSLGPRVAVHELGHSLFELGDEYKSGAFTADSSPNCDFDGCAKWGDLDEHLGGGLCSTRGCKNGDYFVPGSTFMQYLDEPFGEVNTRFTCCTFLALTGGTPSYCDRFEFGKGLVEYCKNDHQDYGLSYDKDNQERANEIDSLISGKYVLVANPATLILNVTGDTFTYDSDMEGEGPKLFRKRKYSGDYPNLSSVIEVGANSVKRLTIEFDSGKEQVLYFSPTETVDMPPNNGSESTSIDNVGVELAMLEIVVDARNGIVIGIDFEVRFEPLLSVKIPFAVSHPRILTFYNRFTRMLKSHGGRC